MSVGVFVYSCYQHGKMDTPSDRRSSGRSMQSKWIENTDGSTLFVFFVIQRTITLSSLSSLLPPLFGGGHCHCEGNWCSSPTRHNHKTESRHSRISATATAIRRNPNPSDRIRKTYRLITGSSTTVSLVCNVHEHAKLCTSIAPLVEQIRQWYLHILVANDLS